MQNDLVLFFSPLWFGPSFSRSCIFSLPAESTLAYSPCRHLNMKLLTKLLMPRRGNCPLVFLSILFELSILLYSSVVDESGLTFWCDANRCWNHFPSTFCVTSRGWRRMPCCRRRLYHCWLTGMPMWLGFLAISKPTCWMNSGWCLKARSVSTSSFKDDFEIVECLKTFEYAVDCLKYDWM